MKIYEFFAHVYLDFSRHFRSASLRVLDRWEKSGDAYATYLAGEVHILVGQVNDAIACFERAAKEGVVEAQIALANHYEGTDQQTDVARARAMHFLQLARDNTSLSVRFPNNPTMGAYLCRRLEGLKLAINPGCLIYIDSFRAEIAARAEQGDPEANHQMGMFCYSGRPQKFGWIEPGLEAAAGPFWTAAAERGHVGSQLLLAYFGSEEWLRRAAVGGHRGAQRELGHLLFEQGNEQWKACRPEGVRTFEPMKSAATDPSIFRDCISSWQRAAEHGCPDSAASLARLIHRAV
jgi:TPR repeat protein